MIFIEEVLKDNISEYWEFHWEYLNRDIFPYETLGTTLDDEEREYFRSDEYRGVLEQYMKREPDKAHFIYFCEDGVRIGCAQYVTYKSEDGKCFIMDFWLFPKYRGDGTGHRCYSSLRNYVKNDGATYVAINISNERNHRFWSSIGFADDGVDEYGSPLMRVNLC